MSKKNVYPSETVRPAGSVTADNIHIDPDTGKVLFDNDAAVKLVMDDTSRDDNWMVINQWPAGWVLANSLYQAPAEASAFDGGIQGIPSIPDYTLSNHINAIVPKMRAGLFYEDPPFLIRPRPGQSQDMAQAKRDLFTFQLDDMEFEFECEQVMFQCALFGTGIAKWGWEEYTKTERQFIPKAGVQNINGLHVQTAESDEFEEKLIETPVARPWFKMCDVRTVLVDSGARVGDIRKAGHVIYRSYPTYDDLDKLRELPGYHIPPRETMLAWFARPKTTAHGDNIAMTIPEAFWGYLQTATARNFRTTSDPTESPALEMLERWDNDTLIIVLRQDADCILIYNGENPYGVIPFYSFNWRNIPDCMYGQGLGLLIGPQQTVTRDINNMALGMLSYSLQPVAVRNSGMNPTQQNIPWELGSVIEVDGDVRAAFDFKQMPPVPQDAFRWLMMSQSMAQETSGANQQVMLGAGAPGVKSLGMRSATGAGLVGQANASRLDGPLERFVVQIFVPWLYQMDELNNRFLPASTLRDILQNEAHWMRPIDHIKFRNAKMDFEALAGAHLGPKQEMAQFMPFLLQFMNNPTFESMIQAQGYTLDAPKVFQRMADISGWKYSQDFLRKMTPQELQRMQQNSPAALQAQKGNQLRQLEAQKFQQERVLQDEGALGRAGERAVVMQIEHSLEPEVSPGNETFGAETA